MFANGPPCIITGVPSSVCTKLGLIASRSNAAMAPSAFKSFAYTGSPSRLYATKMFPRRSFKSELSAARQRIAITSLATVMIKPSSRGIPFIFPPSPTTTLRRARSFISRQRLISTRRWSMRSSFPCCM